MADLTGEQVVGLWLDIASAALFIALGAFVAFVRPRRLLNLAFAVFAVGFGLSLVLLNIGPAYVEWLGPGWTNLQTPINVLWGAAALVVGLLFPTPLRSSERPAWILAAAAIGALAIVQAATVPFNLEGAGTLLQGLEGIPALLYSYSDSWAYIGLSFFLLLPAARAAARPRDQPPGFVGKAALAALALLPYHGLLFGAVAVYIPGGGAVNAWQTVAFLAILPLAGLAWLAAAVRRAGPDRRRALLAGIASFAFPILGAVVETAWPDSSYTSGVLGAARLLGIAVLAYAILRQQLFDIDLRLKASLRHAILGGFFLAVFLIVEQIVQGFTSAEFGLWMGSLVAGVMLVTLAPLQRLSARLADRAMPGVREGEPAYLDERKHAIYRDAYATVWQDGSVTRKEMAFLFRMRDSLGLSAQQCARIEAEWNATMRPEASRPPSGKRPRTGGAARRARHS